MDENTLVLSDNYLQARKEKEEAEQHLKNAKAVCDELEAQLIEAMVNDELDSFKRNGVTVSLCSTTHLSAEPDRKDELWAAMKANDYETLFTINAQTLSAEVKRMMDENKGALPAWLDGLIKQYEKTSIRVRK
jgi:hypothetical protein